MPDTPTTLHDIAQLSAPFIVSGDHRASDYFALLRLLLKQRRDEPSPQSDEKIQGAVNDVYLLIADEIRDNRNPPVNPVNFGTSGWRGVLGKDIHLHSVTQVTQAIINIYEEASGNPELAAALGVANIDEARERGVVLGHDNRFGGEILAQAVSNRLTSRGFKVHYAGETTTGVISAAVLVTGAAFSINLTPSHNPLEYGGFKYNAADAGPAPSIITNRITTEANRLLALESAGDEERALPELSTPLDSLACWQKLVRDNKEIHGIDYDLILGELGKRDDYVLAIDSVHGASRVHLEALLAGIPPQRLLRFRDTNDPTFGGVAPEPSSENLAAVHRALQERSEPLKLGAIIDPDGDRIRFTNGSCEFDMNMFGAICYHYLHEHKGKKGPVAKSVATSNFANSIARGLGEEVFEPRVGFKEFKPVIGKALVMFEESDGISTIGHTPEKDAYIGLLLALDMLFNLPGGLERYLAEIQEQFGRFFPGRGGVEVSKRGAGLQQALAGLERYQPGSTMRIGAGSKKITEVIDIDGRKMILEDGSWLLIRPSGTEPKVRFYLESRSESGKEELLAAAENLLREIGLI